MFNQKKLTEYVWFWNNRWKVEQVISPTEYDDYIIASRVKDEIHIDDKTLAVDVVCIDVHREAFYYDIEEVQQLQKKIQETISAKEEYRRKLDRIMD